MVDCIIVLKKICYLALGEDYTSPILMAIRLDYVCDLLWLPKFNDVYHFPTSKSEEPADCLPSLFLVLRLEMF